MVEGIRGSTNTLPTPSCTTGGETVSRVEMTPAQVRQRLIDALELDLIGPMPDDTAHAEEILSQTPSRWYLTGFLASRIAPHSERADSDEDDTLDELSRLGSGDDEHVPEGETHPRHNFFPSSMGLSVLVAAGVKQFEVSVSWGDYHPIQNTDTTEPETTESSARPSKSQQRLWQRTPRSVTMCMDLTKSPHPNKVSIPKSNGLSLIISERDVPDKLHVLPGTRAVSVFLVNERPANQQKSDTSYVFQTRLVLRSMESFVARPDVKGERLNDWDEEVADLQYRNDFKFAVGHNVSALAIREDNGTACHEVRTAWIPTAEVEKVIPSNIQGIELEMETLANTQTAQNIRDMLAPMAEQYGQWIKNNRALAPQKEQHKKIARDLLDQADTAKNRIVAGLQALADPQVLEAFRLTNRVMAIAARQRFAQSREDKDPTQVSAPRWRPFQLAFLLMNLNGVENPLHSDRELVDLLFFPTGGGKTEAYLGLAAFTLILRRLRNSGIGSAGVSVLMRYTLRLLTLDQLSRAATLICALELERQKDIEKLGSWPFEIGLWVGQSATPNRMGKKGDNNPDSARSRTTAYLRDDRKYPSPIPLENCPWCGEKFNKTSFKLVPDADNPIDLQVYCANRKCTYGLSVGTRINKLPLPILAVDEPIYRRLPCFLLATVDKFASLPWVGETGGLFGKVQRYNKEGFYGPCAPDKGTILPPRPSSSSSPLSGTNKPAVLSSQTSELPADLLPPDLIIQDELHLISGPLGTMVGLYETAIDALSSRDIEGKTCRPKIIASTATVRRASRQIRALFGRDQVDIFPPPGPDRRDSFFAQTVSPQIQHARTYVGIAAPGRNTKVVLLRTYLTLLGAAQQAWKEAGGDKNPDNPADPYMTLVGYFNSLRELGGSRRIVEDEVNSRLNQYSLRRRHGEKKGVFADRKIDDEPLELTSRISTDKVAEAKRRLALRFHEKERVDVALATNMISVGLDITRLGLMVVYCQPKTTAEYIQATSRVGRDEQRPGLVVTILNPHRPRDRSHYEQFQTWHTTFYRGVEATSVTPFSPRAVDRGIAAVTVALARLGIPMLTAPKNAIRILEYRSQADTVAEMIARRAETHDKDLEADKVEELRQKMLGRVHELLDNWETIAHDKSAHNAGLQYQKEEGTYPPLLYYPLDPELERQTKRVQKFKAHRSLRDVEPAVNLWVRTPDGQLEEETEEA